jgi:P-type Ca2+ transporter type 2C
MNLEGKQYFQLNIDDAFSRLQSSETGLSASEAEKRLAEYGENKIEEVKGAGIFKIILDQFMDPLIYILLVAAVVTTLLGELIDTYVILAVVIVNAVIGFTQEFKAENAISALAELTAPISRVIRAKKLWKWTAGSWYREILSCLLRGTVCRLTCAFWKQRAWR